jgi:hypothetical protein
MFALIAYIGMMLGFTGVALGLYFGLRSASII